MLSIVTSELRQVKVPDEQALWKIFSPALKVFLGVVLSQLGINLQKKDDGSFG